MRIFLIVHFDEFYTAFFSHNTCILSFYKKKKHDQKSLLEVMFLLREMIKQFQFFKCYKGNGGSKDGAMVN